MWRLFERRQTNLALIRLFAPHVYAGVPLPPAKDPVFLGHWIFHFLSPTNIEEGWGAATPPARWTVSFRLSKDVRKGRPPPPPMAKGQSAGGGMRFRFFYQTSSTLLRSPPHPTGGGNVCVFLFSDFFISRDSCTRRSRPPASPL